LPLALATYGEQQLSILQQLYKSKTPPGEHCEEA